MFFCHAATFLLTSCGEDDPAVDTITTAPITLQNPSGVPQAGVKVYAYNEITWIVNNDNPNNANFEVTSGSNGIAVFENITSDLVFNVVNEFTQSFRFSAHYTINGVAKTKVISIPFVRGDDKSGVIIFN